VERAWVCGRAAIGRPCTEGPDGRGRCGKRGDEGELTCQPTRSLRARRDLLCGLVAALTLGLVLSLGFGEGSEGVLSAGPLAPYHKGLACAECHAGMRSEEGALPHVDFGEDGCLHCHRFESEGDSSLVHSLPAGDLAGAVERAASRVEGAEELPFGLALARWMSPPPKPGEAMDCSLCHSEHGGASESMEQMVEEGCQVCHTAPFRSFTDGHPELADFLLQSPERSPVAFDHFSEGHLSMQHPEGGADLACNFCHGPAEDAMHIETFSFEETCKLCHEKDVDPAQVGEALVLFSLPKLDPEFFPVEGWPEARQGRASKHEPDAPMQVLMSRSRGSVEPGKRFDKKLARDSQEEGQRYLDELRLTLMELGAGDTERARAAFNERAAVLLGSSADVGLFDEVGGEELAAAFSRAWGEWFEGRDASATESEERFFVDSEEFTVGYRPTGHADPVLTAWTPLMAGAYQSQEFKGAFSNKWFAGCVKCHNVDVAADGSTQMRWGGGALAEGGGSGLSRFAHGPHLGVFPELMISGERWPISNCEACHKAAEGVEEREGFFFYSKGKSVDAGIFESEFSPIQSKLCASCHDGGRARASCLTCHSYHAGSQDLVECGCLR
jgi:hypothetical protein